MTDGGAKSSLANTDVVVLCKGQLEALPPAMSLLERLQPIVRSVHAVVGNADQRTVSALQHGRLQVTCIEPGREREPSGLFGKARSWLRYFRGVRRVLRRGLSSETRLWVASGDTALCVAPLLRSRPYVLQLNELYDEAPLYRTGLAPLARKARAVVVPEAGRAAITRIWMQLPSVPVVIPNKPNSHPRQRQLPDLPPAARAVRDMVESGLKVVLYQGHIHANRDVATIADALSDMGDQWCLVLMGRANSYLNELRSRHPRIVHIPYVPAPLHLAITSWARIGIAVYKPSTLNNAFCAPNKIFEYSGFGIPVIGNDIPGLRYTVHAAGAGLCVAPYSAAALRSALHAVDCDYERFSAAATKFFDGVDLISPTILCLDSLIA